MKEVVNTSHLSTLKRLHKTSSEGPRDWPPNQVQHVKKQLCGTNVTTTRLVAGLVNLCTIPFLNIFSFGHFCRRRTHLCMSGPLLSTVEKALLPAGPCVSDSGYFCLRRPQLWDGGGLQCADNHTPSASLYLAALHPSLPLQTAASALLFAIFYSALLLWMRILDEHKIKHYKFVGPTSRVLPGIAVTSLSLKMLPVAVC